MDLTPHAHRVRTLAVVAASVLVTASALGAAPVSAAVRAPAAAGAARQTDPEPPPPPDDEPAATAALALTGSATDATVAGGDIDGVVTVTNVGPDDLVRAALTIDSDVTETLVDVTVPSGWTCRDIAFVAGQDLFCDAGTFPAGASATFGFRATASSDLVAGDVVVTTVTANAEEPVQDLHPLLSLPTRIVDPTAPVAVTPRFTG